MNPCSKVFSVQAETMAAVHQLLGHGAAKHIVVVVVDHHGRRRYRAGEHVVGG